MSCHRLPRACGTIIKCDDEDCKEVSQTGQMFGHLHASYLRTLGWLVRPSAKKRHLCPAHGAAAGAELKAAKDRAQAKRVKRDVNRKERERRTKLTAEQRKAEDRQRRATKRAERRSPVAA